MGKFRIEIKELAKKNIIQHYKLGDKKSIKNIEKILLELSETPFEGSGNPEPLKYELTGFWSRRINQKDRMIYDLEDDTVTIFVVSAKGHYSDK
ncbi:Txe/YoeB family addiction module toxin [Flavobacterium tistrianum]|uniref:Txe/YoeB family addiction module toxin n=1 Tax=Flavobacterium tistrianum TaxID=1685414 RepID=UPI000DAF29E1|nr:Txe/YoeB family addiction module toxin [Flavobacterium tistrianum]KAF2342784.1 Txe/YoeB family addiction module toxin [Flavobacterium tistrianum]